VKHRRRMKPQRRRLERRDVVLHRNRLMPARVFRIYPDRQEFPRAVVEVRICRNARRLAESNRQQGWPPDPDDFHCAGMVRSFARASTDTPRLHNGAVVAHMWLSCKDLRIRPGEIVSHECGHAAMAWARWRRADLGRMPGEEVMCYALGRLVAQLNRVLYAAGVW